MSTFFHKVWKILKNLPTFCYYIKQTDAFKQYSTVSGLGYSDVENRVKCTPQSIFRIASISKSITMAAVAKLIENGDLDLDKPVQYYVPEFPEKSWDGQKVTTYLQL